MFYALLLRLLPFVDTRRRFDWPRWREAFVLHRRPHQGEGLMMTTHQKTNRLREQELFWKSLEDAGNPGYPNIHMYNPYYLQYTENLLYIIVYKAKINLVQTESQ